MNTKENIEKKTSIAKYLSILLSLTTCTLLILTGCQKEISAPEVQREIETATAESFNQADTDKDLDGIRDNLDIDDDNDGLIEIYTLEELDHIRYNLEGTSYKSSPTDSGNIQGAPEGGLRGYELMRDLNFKDPGSYASGIVRPEWIPQGGHAESASNPGWEPLGNNSNRFRAIFEGNGHTIVNLYINNSKEVYLGLINITSLKAEIRNLGLINSTVRGESYAGGLVGLNDLGTITACYATDGKSISRGRDSVGGLVGYNAGIITKSHATGVMSGTDNRASIGGLVGVNSGTIVASYSGGVMFGTTYIASGGLVAINLGTIVASYSTGVTSGRIHAFLGGLVGFNIGTITASYAMGGTSGTADNSSVRGLIEVNSGTVNESYWNRVSTGQETSAGGRGLSTAEMLATNGSYPDFGTFNPAWRH